MMCHCRYSLELVTGARQLGPKWMEEEPALCLERKNCRWHTSKVSQQALEVQGQGQGQVEE
jgi:hypothetical protein